MVLFQDTVRLQEMGPSWWDQVTRSGLLRATPTSASGLSSVLPGPPRCEKSSSHVPAAVSSAVALPHHDGLKSP